MWIKDEGAPVAYDPNLSVLVRKQTSGTTDFTYPAMTVRDIENAIIGRDQYLQGFHTKQRQIDQLEEYIKDNHDSIDENVIADIAEIFGFELTKEVNLTIKVTFDVNVTVPLHEVDNLSVDAYNWEFDATSSNYDDVEVVGVNITDWYEN